MIRALAALAILTTTPSMAQTCSRPPAPVIPDGATATDAQMSAVPDVLDAYIDSINAHLTCLETEDSAVRRAVEQLLERWEQEKRNYAAAN